MANMEIDLWLWVWRTAVSRELFMRDVEAETVKLIPNTTEGTEDLNQLP